MKDVKRFISWICEYEFMWAEIHQGNNGFEVSIYNECYSESSNYPINPNDKDVWIKLQEDINNGYNDDDEIEMLNDYKNHIRKLILDVVFK
ncbi:hypothetical protein EV201_1286 [Ancylomarina subtilis]|uniref:Uncharacterized protein n=1 Tax=Ancylomarina subtilis TaxID=1639035 RepID=A0A4V6MEK2_9BACT|nr:hypothetical protein [Ancylomarina subtilis]RZT96645.1 hypothetical protein EV201_1286 [Ancylomarina subtilis]